MHLLITISITCDLPLPPPLPQPIYTESTPPPSIKSQINKGTKRAEHRKGRGIQKGMAPNTEGGGRVRMEGGRGKGGEGGQDAAHSTFN